MLLYKVFVPLCSVDSDFEEEFVLILSKSWMRHKVPLIVRMNQYSRYHLHVGSTVYMYTAERIIRILLDPSIDNSKVLRSLYMCE